MSWFKKRVEVTDKTGSQNSWVPTDSRIELFLDSGWLSYMATSGQIVIQDFQWATEVLTGFQVSPAHGSIIDVKDLQLLQKAAKKYFEKERGEDETK